MSRAPTIQQRMAELRIQDLHEEAAHARLVKEARAARRAGRDRSQKNGMVAAARWFRRAPGSVGRVARSVGRASGASPAVR